MTSSATSDLILSAGWESDYVPSSSQKDLNGSQVLCGGKIRADYEEYTNPGNDFTVPRRITLTAAENASIQLRLMYPVTFPNMSRVSNWEPSQYFKNLTIQKDQSHIEVLPENLVLTGWNVGFKCL